MVSVRTLALASSYQLAALVVAAALAAWRWPEGMSGVLLGGLVMSVNFAAARALAAKVLRSKQSRTVYAVGLACKFVVLLAMVGVILTTMRPNVMGFGLGLGTFFVGVMLALLHQSWLTRHVATGPGI